MFIARIIVDFLELILFFIAVYYMVIGIFSFFKKADIPDVDYKMNKFAVIIPAHNEALVIGQLLKSIKNQTYLSDKIDVYVVGDRCTDSTIGIAKSYGAFPLTTSGCEGKAAAIKTGIDNIQGINKEYDCIAIFDADNILDKDCFANMNKMLNCRYSVVQCYVDTKNPYVNWLTRAYSVWYRCENRLSKLANHNLGFGCKIAGTGFAFKTEVLDQCPWELETMAEDLEYTIKLGMSGIKVGFAKNAVLYDEKPTVFKKSVMQRLRWTQGIVDVQGKFGYELLKQKRFGLWLSLYSDFLCQFSYIIFLIINIFATISIITDTNFILCNFWVNPVSYVALNLYLGIGAMSVFASLVVDRKFDKSIVLNLFGLVLYMLSWIPIGIVGIFRHNKKEWYHTEHTGSI